MNRIAAQKPHAMSPGKVVPAALQLVGPVAVASATPGLRLLLHAGHGEAFPCFGVGLGMAAGIAVWTSACLARSAHEGRRVLRFLCALSRQVLLAAAAINLVWWLVPLRLSGP